MPSLNALVRAHTDLSEADLERLHLLVSDWQLLADLSFADLVLWLPDRDGVHYHVGAQMRPTTGPTAYVNDQVGRVVRRGERPLLDEAVEQGRICREGDPEWRDDVPVRVESIPVRFRGRIVAVIGRHTNLLTARTPSRLELTYLQCAADLAEMIAAGRFPDGAQRADLDASPRVGDGLLRLDVDGVVEYASPNALSAYRRLGLSGDLVGADFGPVNAALDRSPRPVDEGVAGVLSGRASRSAEVENASGAVQLRVLPLTPKGPRTGALVLVRDVTELRRRERELITKDATIREIHHRVKNNLQTVAALLRLQARRSQLPEARQALEEAERRVGSIAVVHETLSFASDEIVAFDEVADRVLAMTVDVATTDGAASHRRTGSFGAVPAHVATPLAMVLTEVLQNALEHGLRGGVGHLELDVDRAGDELRIAVEDDGAGLPEGFDASTSASLGLQIVRTLVAGELGGSFAIGPRAGTGTRVDIVVPLPREAVADRP